jgi:hypothetical protein
MAEVRFPQDGASHRSKLWPTRLTLSIRKTPEVGTVPTPSRNGEGRPEGPALPIGALTDYFTGCKTPQLSTVALTVPT